MKESFDKDQSRQIIISRIPVCDSKCPKRFPISKRDAKRTGMLQDGKSEIYRSFYRIGF